MRTIEARAPSVAPIESMAMVVTVVVTVEIIGVCSLLCRGTL
jgi:hypothetical protein